MPTMTLRFDDGTPLSDMQRRIRKLAGNDGVLIRDMRTGDIIVK